MWKSITFLVLINLFARFPVFCQETDSTTAAIGVFDKVEVDASFPGGKDGWVKYLQANLKADIPVKKKAPAGTYRVLVRFIVSKNGKISDLVALTNHGYGMEREVIRVIKKGPDWIPAYQNGLAVHAYRLQPVIFNVVE